MSDVLSCVHLEWNYDGSKSALAQIKVYNLNETAIKPMD